MTQAMKQKYKVFINHKEITFTNLPINEKKICVANLKNPHSNS